eukprot:5194596-Amphidinium_carterae.1
MASMKASEAPHHQSRSMPVLVSTTWELQPTHPQANYIVPACVMAVTPLSAANIVLTFPPTFGRWS